MREPHVHSSSVILERDFRAIGERLGAEGAERCAMKILEGFQAERIDFSDISISASRQEARAEGWETDEERERERGG